VSLPAGNYLFMQNRSVNRESGNDRETVSSSFTADEWLELAIEQHKDGLWERNKMQNVLYARFFREDGFLITQVFRPMV